MRGTTHEFYVGGDTPEDGELLKRWVAALDNYVVRPGGLKKF